MNDRPEPQKEEQRPEQTTNQPEREEEQAPDEAQQARQPWWRSRLHLPTPEQLKAFQEERKHLTITYTTDSLHFSNEGLMNIESILLDMHDYNRAHTRLIHDLEHAEHDEEKPTPPRLTPDPHEVKQIELELPPEWSQPLEPGQHQEVEIHLDIALRRYANMPDQELEAHLDPPTGDIDQNARKAVQELDLDVQAILKEEAQAHNQQPTHATAPKARTNEPTHSPEHAHDDEFGR